MKKIYPEIYKLDTKGKARVWFMEQDGSRYRTIAGIKFGNLVTSEWTQTLATNVGRANERNPIVQATFEIEAAYEKKLTREYHRTLGAADGGAHFFKPMLAVKFEEFAPGFVQTKLDGIRCIAKANGLWSRQGKPILGAPHIMKALQPLLDAAPELVLDGELYNHELKDDFNTIVSLVKKQKPDAEELALSARLVQYHVYDVPSRDENFGGRLQYLIALLQGMESEGIHIVKTVIPASAIDYDDWHGQWLQEGYEGSIWRADAEYQQKRSTHLRKRKEFVDEEFAVSRIIEGEGNWSGMAKAVEFIMPGDKRNAKGERPKAGIKGNQDFARQLLAEAVKHKVVTIKYFALTPDGMPRFGVAIKFHGAKRTL